MNDLQKAVIEAARAYVRSDPYNLIGSQSDPAPVALAGAIDALEVWEKAQDPEVREIGWHEVAEGDQLKSVKTGKFYPVLRVETVLTDARITIELSQGRHTTITRPIKDEPTAFVKRGATGKAVDVFVDVFSSGEAK